MKKESIFNKIKKFLPDTGNKIFNALIVVIILISVVGILTYVYAFFCYLSQNNLSKMFPYIMFILTYVAIINYSIKYFIRHKFTTIYPVVANYSMIVLMSTLNLQNVNNQLVLLAIVIVVAASLIKNNLTAYKRCYIVFTIVFVLVCLLVYLRFYYGYITFDTNNFFDLSLSLYSNLRLIIIWFMFGLLYYMRVNLVFKKYDDEIKLKGSKLAREDYLKKLEEFASIEINAKIDSYDLIAKKLEHDEKKHNRKRGKSKNELKNSRKE